MSSVIKIRGRADPIFRPYAIAKLIKQRKFGDDAAQPPVAKVKSNDLLDLGDEWCGTYGQISSIELNGNDRTPSSEVLEPEPTAEDRKYAQERIREIGKEMGFKNFTS